MYIYHCNYFLLCFGISVDDLKGGHKACDIFLTSFIFSRSVLTTLDTTTSLDKSSTWKNCTSGSTKRHGNLLGYAIDIHLREFYSIFQPTYHLCKCADVVMLNDNACSILLNLYICSTNF